MKQFRQIVGFWLMLAASLYIAFGGLILLEQRTHYIENQMLTAIMIAEFVSAGFGFFWLITIELDRLRYARQCERRDRRATLLAKLDQMIADNPTPATIAAVARALAPQQVGTST